MVEQCIEEDRRMRGMSPRPNRFYNNIPSTAVYTPPRVRAPPPPPKETPCDNDVQSARRGTTRSVATTGRRGQSQRSLKQELIDMLVETCNIGAAGVILGMPGDGNTLMRKVGFDKDTIPKQFLAQHIGGHIRIGILDCNPCFDHDGTSAGGYRSPILCF